MIKKAQIANFNVVFGHEKPMLDYFDTVIVPALCSGEEKKSGDNKFLFMNVRVRENEAGIFVLTGLIVKKTMLEIRSDLNEEGDLIDKNEIYSTAPYSIFLINLLNHRMIFMPNQKGSPTLLNFQSTLRYVIRTYINKKNKNGKIFEHATINVVGIPSSKTIEQVLDNVEKINCLRLKFYPLNGDQDYSDVFAVLNNEIRPEIGSDNGEISFRSPKIIPGVRKILEAAAGTIRPILEVVLTGKVKAIYKDNELSEKYEVDVNDNDSYDKESDYLIKSMDKIKTIQYSSDQHRKVYERNKDRIQGLVDKR